MAWAAEQRTGSGTRKAVLMALANVANHHSGECHPSVARLCEETEFGRTTVKEALTALVEQGLVTRQRRRRADGSLGTYTYTFPHVERADDLEPGDDPSPGSGGDPLNQEVLNQGSEVLVANAPRTSAQSLTGEYVDLVREQGVEPPRRTVGMVAQRTRQLLGEGQDPDVIREALRLMIERRLHPSTLDTLILEAAAGPGRRQRQLSPLEADYEKLKRGEPL